MYGKDGLISKYFYHDDIFSSVRFSTIVKWQISFFCLKGEVVTSVRITLIL